MEVNMLLFFTLESSQSMLRNISTELLYETELTFILKVNIF